MGKPETTAHGTASLIKNLNEEYEIEYGDKLITEGGEVSGTRFDYDGRSLDVSAETTGAAGVVTNGKTLLLLNDQSSTNSSILSYTFGQRWDLSTLSYDNEEFIIGDQAEYPKGMDTDGQTLILTDTGLTGSIFQYSFSSEWDISTLSYDGYDFNTGNQDAQPRGITTDGETVVLMGNETDSIHQYSMDPWDISTLTYDNVSYDISAVSTDPKGAMSDGEFLLFIGDDSNNIHQYSFSSTWDVSTLSEDNQIDASGESSSPNGVFAGNGVAVVSSRNPQDELLSFSYNPDIRLPQRR